MNSLQNLNRQGLLLPGNAKAVVEQFVCGICLDLFLNPVQCHRGGHTYCLHCITEHTRAKPKCPGGCNVKFPIQPPTRNIIAQGFVDTLQCRCPHSPEVVIKDEPPAKKAKREGATAEDPIVIGSAGGSSSSSRSADAVARQCTWTGPFAQLRDHLERCGLEPCGIEGCAFRGRGGVLAAHRLACLKRRVPCPHCQVATALDSLEGHYGVCKEHAALAEANQSQSVPSATIELTIKNVQQKIAGKTRVDSEVPFAMVGFPQGQVCIEVRFGYSDDGVQRDGKTLGVFAYFECPGAPAVEPPPEICYQGTTATLVSQDGAVKNVDMCMTSLDEKAPLGSGWGRPAFCKDLTPFVKDDTIVVKATIRVRPAAPAPATLKHTVA